MEDNPVKPLPGAFRAALAVSIPVLAGYVFLGAAYGVLMRNLGYGVFWTVLMSVIVFGGTIQFVATSLLALGFQPLNAFVISAVINARHLFYGFAMLQKYAGTGWKKPFLVFWLTDETFSLLCFGEPPKGVDKGWYWFFVSALNYVYWMVGGLLGNAASGLFSFDARGIEFVMTSLFAVIVIDQWKATDNHYPALAGLAASIVCLACFGPDYFIIPAMILIVAALLIRRRHLETAEPESELAEELAEEMALEEEPRP